MMTKKLPAWIRTMNRVKGFATRGEIPGTNRHVRRSLLRGYPAWIRTMNNASKGRCVTVTPRGTPSPDFRFAILHQTAIGKICELRICRANGTDQTP